MPSYGYALLALLLLLLIPIGGLFFLARQSSGMEPESIGRDRLSEGPQKPNWVSSATKEEAHQIAPLSFSGDPEVAWKAVQEAVEEMGGSALMASEEYYSHFECRTALFGFVDDLELLLNANERQIEVRSASRAGHSDLGANRKRVEKLTTIFDGKLAEAK